MLTYSQVKNTTFIVSHLGGNLLCFDKKKEIWAMGLTPGVHEGEKIVQYMDGDFHLQFGNEIVAIGPAGNRVQSAPYGEGATKTAANPDFQPTQATAQEVRMRKLLQDINEKSDGLERRMKQVERAEAEKKKAIADKKAEAEAAEKALEEERKKKKEEALAAEGNGEAAAE